ncbi:hypothetical protein L1887_24007 [Cichorium endivia]|nr:hypothetical protein L1887_24007 [Cichorium endivia]
MRLREELEMASGGFGMGVIQDICSYDQQLRNIGFSINDFSDCSSLLLSVLNDRTRSIDFDLIVEYIDSTMVLVARGRDYLKGKSIVGHIEESVDDDALRENVFENVPTGQEVNDNGKEVNEVHFAVDESLEKINNKEINDEILENFVVDTEPLSMTQILNEPSVMTQLEIEAYNIISKQSGKPCSPIHSLVVGVFSNS